MVYVVVIIDKFVQCRIVLDIGHIAKMCQQITNFRTQIRSLLRINKMDRTRIF